MQLEAKIKDVEGKVFEGVSTAATQAFKLLESPSEETTAPIAKSGAELIKAKVTSITDGDTVDILIYGTEEKERLRLILVNTLESKGKFANNPQPYAKEAEAFTKSVLSNQTVWIEKGVQERDQYGRLLAYVWLNSISYEYLGEKREFEKITMNELLLIEGLAKVAVYPPNTQYLDEFGAIEETAKQERKGLWTTQ